METRKLRLELMKKGIEYQSYFFMTLIVAQLINVIFSIIFHSWIILLASIWFIVVYRMEQHKFLPYYNHYKNLKLEEEFDVSPVAGGMSSNRHNVI